MVLLEPPAHVRSWYAVLAAGAAMAGLLAAGRLRPPARTIAAATVAIAAFGLALLGGGVADEFLRPDRWGDLAAALGRGISSLPGARVPYRGLDEWTRIVLGTGGTLIAVLAALAAFWPRHGELGFRHVSLVLLVALYAVPAVALDRGAEFLSGALLALLVLAYLRLERLRISDTGAAAALAAGVTVLALVAAPTLDTEEPWFDYETWALSNAASKSTSFSWEHGYGPLNWPRDGRELLRVKARQAAYWKAMNLDAFDGRRWVRDEDSGNLDGCDLGPPYDLTGERRRWLQRIRVSVRNLRTPTFVAAGITCAIEAPRLASLPLGDGTYATATRSLRRGDAYGATVYTPTPTERQRRASGDFHPEYFGRYTRVELPSEARDPATGVERPADEVQFSLYGDPGPPLVRPADQGADPVPGRRTVARGPYARTYRLAQQLKAGTTTQEEFVQRVERHLGSGEYAYTEAPPVTAENLEGFLFEAKSGYCQQFSGAMALLLRMGGVPARVSTGFTSGSYDRKAREYVVRDLDAHSWVEVYYAGYGWVTFDPTPAASPARSQPEEAAGAAVAGARGAPDLGGDVRSDPSRRTTAAEQGGTSWRPIAWGGAALAFPATLGLWLMRRHRRRVAAGWGPLDELERALRRSRRGPAPGATLRAIEAGLGRSPAAAGYVRTIREARYGGRAAAPSRSGRRALRAELARGGGLRGRLRAWWAVPPGHL
jgi:transglutaminase-like putative cysteine protease